MENLRVGPSTIHGRGVFAERRFAAGEVVERCEVLRVPQAQRQAVAQTVFYEYLYDFGDGDGDVALALGYGSLYNHSVDANADYFKDAEHNLVVITARRDIAAGDEVTLRYQYWESRRRD